MSGGGGRSLTSLSSSSWILVSHQGVRVRASGQYLQRQISLWRSSGFRLEGLYPGGRYPLKLCGEDDLVKSFPVRG